MPIDQECHCPLCNSAISREVYERVLRIDQARKEEVASIQEEARRKLAQIEEQRAQIVKRAAEVERKKVLAESAKVTKRLNDEIARTKTELRKEHQRHERTVEAQVRAAKQEASRLNRDLLKAKKDAEAERKRLERDAVVRLRNAKEAAALPHLRAIEKLNGELKVQEDRRHREVESLNRAISELKQKAEAQDHAHFGPEGEEELMEALRAEFPEDKLEHLGKGGDVIQTVLDSGRPLGSIIYECKRTASWQVAFTRQLKQAMEAHGTRYGVLVSRRLPRKSAGICTANHVLVAEPHLAVQVACLLRETIVGIGRARLSEDGKAAKTEEVYRYLCSDDFSNAISRIDDKIRELRGNLEKEKSSHDGWWRNREQHYATILREASGVDARIKEILAARSVPTLAKVQRLHG